MRSRPDAAIGRDGRSEIAADLTCEATEKSVTVVVKTRLDGMGLQRITVAPVEVRCLQ